MQTTFYTEAQLDAVTTLSRATRWRMRQKGEFPNPVKISKGRVAYPALAIEDWVNSKTQSCTSSNGGK